MSTTYPINNKTVRDIYIYIDLYGKEDGNLGAWDEDNTQHHVRERRNSPPTSHTTTLDQQKACPEPAL